MKLDLDATHDAEAQSWVESANPAGADFPIQICPLEFFGDAMQAPRR